MSEHDKPTQMLSYEQKKRIAEIVYTDCTLLPGANFYTAAEFAVDATLAQISKNTLAVPPIDAVMANLSKRAQMFVSREAVVEVLHALIEAELRTAT